MRRHLAMAALFALQASSAGAAETPCGLCAKSVTINAELAACFLKKFPEWQKRSSAAVVVDLTDCQTGQAGEENRGIVAALPLPGVPSGEPDLEYILTLGQLVCLKSKLEAPELKLDPAATISLESCQ